MESGLSRSSSLSWDRTWIVDDSERRLSICGSFSLFCYVWPTLPNKGRRQCVMGRWDTRTNEGYGLGINPQGRLEFWVGDGKEVDYVTAELPLIKKVWYFIGVSFNYETGTATLYQEGLLNRYNSLIGKVAPYDFSSHVQTKFRFQADEQEGCPVRYSWCSGFS